MWICGSLWSLHTLWSLHIPRDFGQVKLGALIQVNISKFSNCQLTGWQLTRLCWRWKCNFVVGYMYCYSFTKTFFVRVSATTSSARGDAVTVLAMIAGSSCASTPAYDFKQIGKKTLGPLFLHHISSQNLHIARSICLAVKEEAHSEQMDSGS